MRRATAIADTAARLTFRLVLAAHVMFFLSFAVFLFIASSRAQGTETHRSQAPVCTGDNLLVTLAAEDPKALDAIRAEAAATLNGEGLLWKLEKQGTPTSWLFGTMHMTDPRVTDLPPAARTAFDGSGTVVIETVDILDQQQMMQTLAKHPELMMFTDGTTLFSLIPEADRAGVEAALEARGIPPGSVAKMKPWMLAALVALPACEMARKTAGEPVLDIKLAQDAKAEGKVLKGLESVADQLGAMASLPMEFHIKGLVDTLKLGDRMDDVIETMIALYEEGGTGMFWPLFRAVLPQGEGDESGYVAFEKTMITSRNHVMAERSGPILADGGAFIAVGALHLPGPDGLVELFRRDGFTVTRAD